ncbi:hypothetical protein [Kitasatospora sp. NPDC006786]|uniref:hypothetical protein n=1 Tax=unclassified Kitasatospora TaxID=2633591 RepID=UPI0033C38909
MTADFVPRDRRRTGLRVSTYRVATDGTRYDRTPEIDLSSGPPADPDAYHPDKGWPFCQCPRHRPT